jgi:hypothetical protein
VTSTDWSVELGRTSSMTTWPWPPSTRAPVPSTFFPAGQTAVAEWLKDDELGLEAATI